MVDEYVCACRVSPQTHTTSLGTSVHPKSRRPRPAAALLQRAIDYKMEKRTYLTSARRSLSVRLNKLAFLQTINPAFLPCVLSILLPSPLTPRRPTASHNNSLDTTNQTHLLKLIWPLGPVRTVIPEVPVEPAVLGAGLGLEAAAEAESE